MTTSATVTYDREDALACTVPPAEPETSAVSGGACLGQY